MVRTNTTINQTNGVFITTRDWIRKSLPKKPAVGGRPARESMEMLMTSPSQR